jgi:hypothetical protein
MGVGHPLSAYSRECCQHHDLFGIRSMLIVAIAQAPQGTRLHVPISTFPIST